MITIYKREHMGWEDNETTAVDFFEIFLDTSSDLPTDVYQFSTETSRYKIGQGSLAYDISTGDMYMMQSDGTWVVQ